MNVGSTVEGHCTPIMLVEPAAKILVEETNKPKALKSRIPHVKFLPKRFLIFGFGLAIFPNP